MYWEIPKDAPIRIGLKVPTRVLIWNAKAFEKRISVTEFIARLKKDFPIESAIFDRSLPELLPVWNPVEYSGLIKIADLLWMISR